MAPHAGSWFGLPDFGITEKIGGLLGSPTTSQGGSNILGGGGFISPAGGGQVLSTQDQSAYSGGGGFSSMLNPMGTAGGGQPTPPPAGDVGGGGGGQNIASLLDQDYASRLGELGGIESGLGEQRGNLEGIAQNTYQTGYDTLTGQKEQSTKDIQSGQVKTLNDLADALKQMWQQGNVMLGTRGASDSSAAKQYSYALAKAGSKQQGDVMQENARRLDSINQTYNQNVNILESEKQNKLMEIANWFIDSQNQIRTMKSGLAGEKSQQLLNLAIQNINDIRSQYDSTRNVLDQWAANKAQSLPQLTQMLAQNAQNLPAFQGLFANMQGGGGQGGGMFGFGQGTNDQQGLFK